MIFVDNRTSITNSSRKILKRIIENSLKPFKNSIYLVRIGYGILSFCL